MSIDIAGASTKEIQEAGGWKTITQAARYSHLSPAHKESVVRKTRYTTDGSNCHLKCHQGIFEDWRNGRDLRISHLESWCREGGSNPHEVALGGF
jgi:hypothetical protein